MTPSSSHPKNEPTMETPAIQRILDQMHRGFYRDPWHGPAIMEILDGVTHHTAGAKSLASVHTIAEIVAHLTVWKHTIRRRLDGEALDLTGEEDWPSVETLDIENWEARVSALRTAHDLLAVRVAELTDDDLLQTVPGKDFTVYFILHGVVQHDAYHGGQIALLKKGGSSHQASEAKRDV